MISVYRAAGYAQDRCRDLHVKAHGLAASVCKPIHAISSPVAWGVKKCFPQTYATVSTKWMTRWNAHPNHMLRSMEAGVFAAASGGLHFGAGCWIGPSIAIGTATALVAGRYIERTMNNTAPAINDKQSLAGSTIYDCFQFIEKGVKKSLPHFYESKRIEWAYLSTDDLNNREAERMQTIIAGGFFTVMGLLSFTPLGLSARTLTALYCGIGLAAYADMRTPEIHNTKTVGITEAIANRFSHQKPAEPAENDLLSTMNKVLSSAPYIALIYDLYNPIERVLETALPTAHANWKADIEQISITSEDPSELINKAVAIGRLGALCSSLFLRYAMSAPLIFSVPIAAAFGAGAAVYTAARIPEIKFPSTAYSVHQLAATLRADRSEISSIAYNYLQLF